MEGDMRPGVDRRASPGPHRIPERVLAWPLGPLGGAGESIVGDLRQEHGRMVREAGALAAARWHWRQALGIGMRAARDRLRRRGPVLRGRALCGAEEAKGDESFSFPRDGVAVYLPLAIDLATSNPSLFGFNAVARVTPGTTTDQLRSQLLALAAGAVGVLLGAAGVAGFVRTAPPNLSRLSEIGLEPLVIAYAAGLTALIALLLALIPAIRLTSPSVLALVSRSGTRTTAGRDRLRTRQALVVPDGARAGAAHGQGLMLRTFSELHSLDPGFDPEGVLTFRITLPEATYPDAQSVAYLHDRLLERLRALPGVESAGGAREAFTMLALVIAAGLALFLGVALHSLAVAAIGW
jgi:hypothetical protein